MANKGEWGEPYAALRILGDGKLYIAPKVNVQAVNSLLAE